MVAIVRQDGFEVVIHSDDHLPRMSMLPRQVLWQRSTFILL